MEPDEDEVVVVTPELVDDARTGINLLRVALRGAEAAEVILRAIDGADERFRQVTGRIAYLEEQAETLAAALTDAEAQLTVLRQVIDAEKRDAVVQVQAAYAEEIQAVLDRKAALEADMEALKSQGVVPAGT